MLQKNLLFGENKEWIPFLARKQRKDESLFTVAACHNDILAKLSLKDVLMKQILYSDIQSNGKHLKQWQEVGNFDSADRIFEYMKKYLSSKQLDYFDFSYELTTRDSYFDRTFLGQRAKDSQENKLYDFSKLISFCRSEAGTYHSVSHNLSHLSCLFMSYHM